MTVLSVLAFALAVSPSFAGEFDQTHQRLDDVLHRYVKNARVDYAGLKAHPQELNRYLDEIAAVTKSNFTQWSEKQQLAFLINGYNAYTLKLILDHYPIKSIKDIGHFWSGPWDQPVVHLFGKTIMLNTIEQDMLRKNYHEPRIHFAIVCASSGCPPLRNEAYVATRLDKQLNDQARQFLANRNKNRVDQTAHVIYLSPIFKWYAGDFEKNAGSVLKFIKPFWPDSERAELEKAGSDNFQIEYTDYDWSLNAQGK
ncbi:MAG TPA: DUF547 domain-containing protein [Candidatus Binatia bacterium]|nr:DUF547 domain-containing protein [Candidatus Binatia bacterium]